MIQQPNPRLNLMHFKSIYLKDICIPIFTALLFIIAKISKQPKCLSTCQWTKKMWYTHTLEFYSATRKKETISFTTWLSLRALSYINSARKRKTNTNGLLYLSISIDSTWWSVIISSSPLYGENNISICPSFL